MKKRMVAFLAFLCGGAALLNAATIPIDANCKVALVAYMNGALEISLTGSTALTLTQCEIQLRAHGAGEETAWSATQTVNFSLLGPGSTDQGKGKYCSYATALSRNTDVRFRALVSSTGDATEWIVQENVRVEPYPLTPTAYTKTASYNPAGGLDILKNGKQDTIVELNPSSSEWVQFDLGSTKTIAGLRVLPRLAFADRLQNAIVKVSDNADMTDAQTVIAATPAPGASLDAADWAFSQVVQARYIRVTAFNTWIDITEAEPYSDRPSDSQFSLSVQQNAYNDAKPKITFKAAWGAVDGWTLERGFAAAGPWDTVATGAASLASLVDTVPNVPGATYFYRARFACRTTAGTPIEITTPVVSHLHARALERDWGSPSQLYADVSILTDCQMNPSYPISRAFDGNIDGNFAGTTANPLIGLDLGKACYLTLAMVRSRTSGYGINTPISFWGANVLPENTAAAQTADDPNHTQLYRNTESGGGSNLGYWYRFPVSAPQAAYRYAFLHKNATDAAAQNWGNVNEVTFYGYDADDVAAAQVIAPETFTVHREVTGIRLAWTHGYNVGAWEVQRKAGEGEWTTVATPETSDFTYLDPASGLENGTDYAYRLKATQGDLVRYSSVGTFYWYAAGAGTGLLATYSAPSPLASCDTNETYLGSETVQGIDVTKAAGETIYGTAADHVLVAWKGKLIVPIAGAYTFTAEATDGFMLEIDGGEKLNPNQMSVPSYNTSAFSVLNGWNTTGGAVTTRTRSGYTLTAGEHTIRAWWNPSTGAKSCVLKWTLPGAANTEVIPVTQFLPADTPDPETYGKEGWRFRSVSNTRGFAVQGAEDAFTISEADTVNDKVYKHGSFLWKKLSSRYFTFEACVYAAQMFSEYGGLFVSENLNNGFTGDGATLFLYRLARKDGVNARYRAAGQTENTNIRNQPLVVSAPGGNPDNNNDWCWMRITRDGDRFTLKVRHGTQTAGGTNADCPWTEVATYVDTEKRFGKDVYIGLASTTLAEASQVYQARYLFSNVKTKTVKGISFVLR